jgi:hypothetical protein
MYLRIVFLASALLMSSNAFSQEMRVQLANKSAKFSYLTEAFGQDFGRLELEAGLLYNTDNDSMFNLGLLVRGESVSVPLIVAIGARAYYANVRTYNIGAIAIGGDLLLSPESWGGLGVGVNYYTAPGVVSFLDAKDVTEYGIYLSYQITPQANISLGYKNIEADIKNVGNVEIDKGGYFGLNLSF